MLRKAVKSSLLSDRKPKNFLLEFWLFRIISSTTFACNFTSIAFIPRWMADWRPSLNAQILSMTLVVTPTALESLPHNLAVTYNIIPTCYIRVTTNITISIKFEPTLGYSIQAWHNEKYWNADYLKIFVRPSLLKNDSDVAQPEGPNSKQK